MFWLLTLPFTLLFGLVVAVIAGGIGMIALPFLLLLWLPFVLVRGAFRLVGALLMMVLALVGVLLLGVVFTGLSGFLYITLLGHVSAQAAGVIAFLEPVSAAFLAWAILDEPLGPAVLVGGLLVLASGVAVVLREPPDATAIETLPLADAVPEPEPH